MIPSTSKQFGPNELPESELDLDENGQYKGFGGYMQAKVAKLKHQVHANVVIKSQLFRGISIYVNGYTNPPAFELRKLITENGGSYHHYYSYGHTTYAIASSLASSKWNSLRKNELILKPTWVTDSLLYNKVLPFEHYILTPTDATSVQQHTGVDEFFQRSRLHLISTLAQDLKTFVAELRSNPNPEFPSRSRLEGLSDGNHVDLTDSIICHIDMDCFFVSVALRTRPELKGKPVAITQAGDTHGKGFAEISSCSYEARKFNIHARMWVNEAVKLCPDLICLPYEFEHYRETSKLLYSIISKYTLDIKAISCDEMYIDLTSLCKDMKISDPSKVIKVIRDDIEETTQCTASAGLGPNMLIARLATKKAKPNGQFYVNGAEAKNFIKHIKIEDLPGVGYSAMEKIESELGDLKTCHDLKKIDLGRLQRVFGQKMGKKIFDSCRGISEPFTMTEMANRKTISCDVNFGVRLKTVDDLRAFLSDVAKNLSQRLKASHAKGRTIGLRLLIRSPGAPIEPAKFGAHGQCEAESKAFTLPEATDDQQVLLNTSMGLAKRMKPVISDIRGIGLHASKLDYSVNKRPETPTLSPSQMSLHGFIMKRRLKDTNETIDLTDDKTPEPTILKRPLPAKRKKVAKKKFKTEQELVEYIGKLPEADLLFCVCGCPQHEVSLDLNSPPDFEELLKLRCKLYRLCRSEQWAELREEYSDLFLALYDSPYTPIAWLESLVLIREEINRNALKLSKIKPLPEDFSPISL